MAHGLELLARLLAHLPELRSMAPLHSHELGSPRLCCGADALQHAEGGQPLEQVGALELGDRSLLLGRALAVPERAVVLGRLVKHRVAEKEWWSCVLSVSDGLPDEHPRTG